MNKLEDTKNIFILIIYSLLILLFHLAYLPPNIMEARNFISAREMLFDNHWILTTLNGIPRYEKPPLPTWLTAVFYQLCGNSLFWLRLPVVLVTVLLVVFIYLFSKKLKLSPRQSLHNGLILITSFYIFFSGRDNNWDMYCHSFMIISIYFLWNILQKNTNFLQSILGGLFLGFSILSKGPISLYALLLPFLISYFIVYKLKNKDVESNIRNIYYLLVYLFIGIITGLSWYIYIRIKDPEYFIQIIGKESVNWISYERKPFYYYWNFFIQSGVWTFFALISLCYPYLKNKVNNLKAYQFTLLWTLGSLLLLSVIPEKKVRYLLPVLIPLALNIGFYIDYLWRNYLIINKYEKIYIYFTLFPLILLALLFPFIPTIFNCYINKNKTFIIDFWFYTFSISFFFVSALFIYGVIKKQFNKIFYSIIILQLFVVVFGFPLINNFMKNSLYNSSKNLQKLKGDSNISIYEYKAIAPEIVWDFGEKIPIFHSDIIQNKKEFTIGVLVEPKDTLQFRNEFKNYDLVKGSIIDLNTNSKESSNYRERLVRYFYIIMPE